MTDIALLVCVNQRWAHESPSCAGRGSPALRDALEQACVAAGLAIPCLAVPCLGYCDQGPNVRLAPGGPFFHQVTPADVPNIIATCRAWQEKTAAAR